MRAAKKHLLLYGSLGTAVAASIVVFIPGDVVALHKDIRGYLFSGLMTLGSFLLSTKTFIVTRLQEGLFQLPEYNAKWEIFKEQNPSRRDEPRNAPLRELTEYISLSVFSCLSISVVQLGLSFAQSIWASAIGLCASASVLFFVLNAWSCMRRLIQDYLEAANKIPIKERE
jgi:hypothetical protein